MTKTIKRNNQKNSIRGKENLLALALNVARAVPPTTPTTTACGIIFHYKKPAS